MFTTFIARHASHGLCSTAPRTLATRVLPSARLAPARFISSTSALYKSSSTKTPSGTNNKPIDDPLKAASTAAEPGESSGAHEGRYARTDESVRVEYPPDDEMPRTPVVQGRGGRHFKRTLASFSLEGRVSVITGGARGLGLVMGQALVASGSDLAIVDLNGMAFKLLLIVSA